MQIEHIQAEVRRFLSSPDPEVLCITGKWGVGKTHAWKELLKGAQLERPAGFPRYAYVSLFGLDDLKAIRSAIVEQTVSWDVPGLLPDPSTVGTSTSSAFRLFNKARPWASLVPNSTGYTEAIRSLLYLAVRKQVICLDDLERAGKAVAIRDVLGLASELKEQKLCKVLFCCSTRTPRTRAVSQSSNGSLRRSLTLR